MTSFYDHLLPVFTILIQSFKILMFSYFCRLTQICELNDLLKYKKCHHNRRKITAVSQDYISHFVGKHGNKMW